MKNEEKLYYNLHIDYRSARMTYSAACVYVCIKYVKSTR